MPLFGGSPDVRKLKARRNVSGLIKALAYKEDPKIVLAAIEALGEVGDARALGALVPFLKQHGHKDLQVAAASALGKIGDARAIKPLLEFVRGLQTPQLLQAGHRALGRIRDPQAIGLWIEVLNDRDDKLRRVAVALLGEIGDKRAVEPLLQALKSPDASTRGGAAASLGKLGDHRAVEPLIQTLEDTHLSFHYEWRDDRWVMHGGKSLVCTEATRALGQLGSSEAIEPLAAVLGDADIDRWQSAAEALDKLGWQPSQDQNGAHYWIAKGQWERCVEIGAPAIEPLKAIIKSRSSWRRTAAETLDKLGWQPDLNADGTLYWFAKGQLNKCVEIGAPAVEPLISILSRTSVDAWLLDEDANAAILALAQIGDLRAVEPLTALLNHKNETIRHNAAHALSEINEHSKPRATSPLTVEIAILRSTSTVWALFTESEKWRAWWGADLVTVQPGWQDGATLTWANGDISQITSIIPLKELCIASAVMQRVWSFASTGTHLTVVEMRSIPQGRVSFSDGGKAHTTEMASALARFKQLVEGETAAG